MADTNGAPIDAPMAARFDAAIDAPMGAAIAADAGVPRRTHVRRGRGKCRVDADCVLTTYQHGCCVQACNHYAISIGELTAAQATEDCAAFHASGTLCPPPAPCPVQTYRMLSAKCDKGVCAGIAEAMP